MDVSRPRLLILTDWFHPGYKAGGPIQSTVNLAIALQDIYSVFVLTTDTDLNEKQPYENIIAGEWGNMPDTSIAVCYLKKSSLTTAEIRKQLLYVQPDFVYLNHLFSPLFVIYPLWLKLTGIVKAKMVLCPRGALYDSALAIKPAKKKMFIALFRMLRLHKKIYFHATNEREKEAIERFFPGSDTRVANNLGKMLQPPITPCCKKPGAVKCIFIARLVPIKNLLFLLSVLKQTQAYISLTIVGPVEDASYWESCLQEINKLPSNVSINIAGPVPNYALAELLVNHHLFCLPTTGENFGHSIFEAFIAGRPVLISDQTPWLKLAEKHAGWDLPLSQPEAFRKALETAAAWPQEVFNTWSQAAYDFATDFIHRPQLLQPYKTLFS